MIRRFLDDTLSAAFAAAGYDDIAATAEPSRRPDVGQFQCTTPLTSAKRFRQSPVVIANAVVRQLPARPFARVSVDGPGFINFSLDDAFLATATADVLRDPRQGCPTVEPQRLLLDFGGPNVAKRMHVGHLRSAIIGDCLQRCCRFLGHDVVSDVHLGDWGLPMGMLIAEIRARWPELPCFTPSSGEAGALEENRITVDLLSQLYPEAAKRAAVDEEALKRAKDETAALQGGDSGLRRLWRRMVDVSVASVRTDFSLLGVSLDLWEGESDVHGQLTEMIGQLVESGAAQVSEGALVIPLERPGDAELVPPLMLVKSDGSVTYGATDLATIARRVELHEPDGMWYVVDQRQRLHFVQVFRAAQVTGLATPGHPSLEHIGFGTVNGPDGRPFRTRAGETMTLRALLELTIDEAKKRIGEIALGSDITGAEREEIALRIALATIKFADLRNQRQSDYLFDLAQFSSFEGKTGPYVCYTAVRARSILTRAAAQRMADAPLLPPRTQEERRISLQLLDFGRAVLETFERRAPNVLCEHAFELAQGFNAFYHTCHILSEPDVALRGSRLTLARGVRDQLVLALSLLGIEAPDRM